MTTKMKGLLKGLRYISQIFDNEKEPELQIGYPTDVKHVAHIGWDGPSVNSPSWMNEFRSRPEFSSAPLGITGEATEIQWVSEDSSRRGPRIKNSPARELPELPKASRRHSSASNSLSIDSPNHEIFDKPKQSRRHLSVGSSNNSPTRGLSDSTTPTYPLHSSSLESGSPSKNPRDNIPKKTRRKKSKDSSGSGSTRFKARAHLTSTSLFSDPGSGSESGSVSRFKDNELSQTSSLNDLQEREEMRCNRIS